MFTNLDAGSADADPPAPAPAPSFDPLAVAHLWAGQFTHLATLGVAGAGGVLVMLQAGLLGATSRWWVILLSFALTALFGIYGHNAVVDDATAGRLPGRGARIARNLAFATLGAAGGGAIASFF